MSIDLAMNQGFWTYLTHNNFREYVLNRFVKKNPPAEGTIKERFFVSAYPTDRALERNAVARLWWAGKLTTNFEKDPELNYFFSMIKTTLSSSLRNCVAIKTCGFKLSGILLGETKKY